jgi:hypothetical protein
VLLLIVAVDGLEELHTPPGTVLVNVKEDPAQRPAIPEIGPGAGFTVINNVLLQPELNV